MKHIKGKIMACLVALIIICVIIFTSENKLLVAGIIAAVAVLAFAVFKLTKYLLSGYYKSTKDSYFKVLFNKEKSFRYSVYKCFNKQLNGTVRCICDIYMPKVDGTTAKADMILISETGVWVIDAKKISGKVVGNESGETWDHIAKGKTTQIPNPAVWNKLYSKWLHSFAKDYPHTAYFSFIIRGNGCNVKEITIKNNDASVIRRSELKKEIMRTLARVGTSLAGSEIDIVYNQFKELTSEEKAKSLTDVQGIQETIFFMDRNEANKYDAI